MGLENLALCCRGMLLNVVYSRQRSKEQEKVNNPVSARVVEEWGGREVPGAAYPS